MLLPELAKAAANTDTGILGLIVGGITTLISLNTRLAVSRLHSRLTAEQEARCHFCEAVRFEPRRSPVDAAALLAVKGRKKA